MSAVKDNIKITALAALAGAAFYMLGMMIFGIIFGVLLSRYGIPERSLLPIVAIVYVLFHVGLLYTLGLSVGRRVGSGSTNCAAVAGVALSFLYLIPFSLFFHSKLLPSADQMSWWMIVWVITWALAWPGIAMVGGWSASRRDPVKSIRR